MIKCFSNLWYKAFRPFHLCFSLWYFFCQRHSRILVRFWHQVSSYLYEGYLTTKSDVYSFGVVMLELLSGRRAIDKNRPSGEHNLVDWAKPFLASKRKVIKIFDPRIEGQYTLSGALKAVTVAIQCISTEPKHRPSMKEVVKSLEQLQESDSAESLTSSPRPRDHQSLNGKSSNSHKHPSTSHNPLSTGKAASCPLPSIPAIRT